MKTGAQLCRVLLLIGASCAGGQHPVDLPVVATSPDAAVPPPAVDPTAPIQPLLAVAAPEGESAAGADEADHWKARTDLIKAPARAPAAAISLPQVMRWKLKNGLDIVLVPRPELPVVSLSLAVKVGTYDEDAGSAGLAEFTASMLRQGTTTRSADDIAEIIDYAGGTLAGDSTDDHSNARCTTLSKELPLCLDLLSDVVVNPVFPEDHVGEIRDQLLAGLKNRFENPDALAAAHFANLIFGDDHPGGRVVAPERLRAITRDDLVRFWKTYYRPNNSVLAVVGAVDPAKVKAAIEERFGAWQSAPIPPRPAFVLPQRKGARLLLVDRDDAPQATVLFGHRGIRHTQPEWFPATLLNYVIGGAGAASRLMADVRTQRGLAYGISSTFGASLFDGAFEVTASTANDKVWEALMAAVNQLRAMKADGPTVEELDAGKVFFSGSYAFKMQGAEEVASAIVAAELHGLGVAYVKQFPVRMSAVGVARAKQVAQSLLRPEELVIVIVGRGDLIAPQIDKAGLKYERIHFRDPISFAERAARRKAAVDASGSTAGRDALALVKKGIEAQGGEQKLRALADLTIVKSGSREQGGATVDLVSTTYFKRPDRMRVEQTLVVPGNKTRMVFVVGPKAIRGSTGNQPLGPLPPVNQARLKEAMFEDINFILLNILDARPPIGLQPVPAVREKGRVLEGVLLKVPSGEWLTLYFDTATHLLARMKSPGEGGDDLINEIDDYRDVGGIKISHHQSSPGDKASEAIVTEVKVNQGLAPALFE